MKMTLNKTRLPKEKDDDDDLMTVCRRGCSSRNQSGRESHEMALSLRQRAAHQQLWPRIFVLFVSSNLFAILVANVCAQNTTTVSTLNGTRDTGVTDLQLVSDFRAVKLRWTYKHSEAASEPASFLISYCELTSWNIQIKCRHRHMKVIKSPNWPANNSLQPVITPDNFGAPDSVYRSPEAPDLYEAHIYDLRALTNYTVNVHVVSFSGDTVADTSSMANLARQRAQSARRLDYDLAHKSQNSLADRIETKPFRAEATNCLADVSEVLVNTGRYFGGRISVENSSDPRCQLIGNKSSEQSSYLFRIDHELCNSKLVDGNRIETMVLVHENKDILTHNTARFLVLCNFSQKSFTLRASVYLPKVNSAGGSLPASSQPTRQAVITTLARKPTMQELAESDHNSVPVMLGSMPGFFLPAKNGSTGAGHATIASDDLQTLELPGSGKQRQQQQVTSQEKPAVSDNRTGDNGANFQGQASEKSKQPTQLSSNGAPGLARKSELETNIIETFAGPEGSDTGRSPRLLPAPVHRKRQQSHRQAHAIETMDLMEDSSAASSPIARSLTLLTRDRVMGGEGGASASKGNNGTGPRHSQAPAPVNVQSKVLYVIRSDPVSGSPAMASVISANAGDEARRVVAVDHPMPDSRTVRGPVTMGALKAEHASKANDSHKAARINQVADSENDSSIQAITLTNNHRVSDEFASVAQVPSHREAARAVSEPDPNGFSIKYSSARVDEYSLGSSLSHQIKPTPQSARGRSGRMRSVGREIIDSNELPVVPLVTDAIASEPSVDGAKSIGVSSINRMGEMQSNPQMDDLTLGAESSAADSTRAVVPPLSLDNSTSAGPTQTLAQNITGYLLKWSLKTLTNLARKSLESLAQEHNETFDSRSSELANQRGPTAHHFGHEEPTTIRTAPTTLTASTRRQILASTTTTTTSTKAPETSRRTGVANPSPDLQRRADGSTSFSMTDGLLTNKRRVGDQSAGGATSKPVAARQSTVSDQRSSRISDQPLPTTSSRQRTLETEPSIETNNPRQLRPPPTYSPDMAAQNRGYMPADSDQLARTTSLLSWFLYSLTLVICFLSLVFVIFWLLFLPTKFQHTLFHGRLAADGGGPCLQSVGVADLDSGSLNRSTPPPPRPQAMKACPDRQLTPGRMSYGGSGRNDGSYQKYDHFSNAGSLSDGHAPSHLLLSPKPATSDGFQSNLSTISREKDCKNSEFVYTEHVLINSGNSLGGESFA